MGTSRYPDVGDLDDLQARLSRGSSDTSRRTVFVLGSGLSNSVMPDVSAVVGIFRSYLSERGQARFDRELADQDPKLAYQNAAALLKRQAGDAVVAQALREATLHACRDVGPSERRATAEDVQACETLELDGEWSVPRGYESLAVHVASGASGARPTIITTNFDPLVEIAMRHERHVVHAVPISADAAPTPEQVRANPGIPILHVHGYWLSSGTLNTVTQLTRPRPLLAGLLREQLRNSLILVLGYSGWADGFMASLRERAGEMDLLGSEILWASYDRSPEVALANETIRALYGTPNFTLYCGIDGNEVFGGEPSPAFPVTVPPIERVSPFGYTIVAKGGRRDEPADPKAFLAGGQPSWADAQPGVWPQLSATDDLWGNLQAALSGQGPRGAVAVGPTGEGKSLALKQLAVRAAAEYPDWTVLWREPGAPPVTREWIERTLEGGGPVLVCADEADLIAENLLLTRDVWAARRDLVWLLGSHDRLWWRHGQALSALIVETVFHGLTRMDALAIAQAWSEFDGKQPGRRPAKSVAEVAEALIESASRVAQGSRSTLFGAVLDVRFGPALVRRLSDLLKKLDTIVIRPGVDVTLADIYGIVCLMQDTLDENGALERGATRSVLAAAVGLDGVFADGKILQLLGREAAITYAGDRVYSRHPSIARVVVQLQRESARSIKVAGLAGLAGGRLRVATGVQDREFRSAFLLGMDLKDKREAVAAGEGAVKGARGLLEPYVTLLKIRRRFGEERTLDDAKILAGQLSSFKDYGTAIRVFLVESSTVARAAGQPQLAVGLAALSLLDGVGFHLDARQASYALTSLTHAACTLRTQVKGPAATPEIAATLIDRLAQMHDTVERATMKGLRHDLLDDLENSGTRALLDQLLHTVHPMAVVASREFGLTETVGAHLSFEDLKRLFSADRPGRPPGS